MCRGFPAQGVGGDPDRSRISGEQRIECVGRKRGIDQRQKTDGEKLYKLASQGNKKSLKLWNEYGTYLGVGLTTTINAYDPEIIVLGGQLSKAYKFFKKSMRKEMEKRALLPRVPVVISKVNRAPILGAFLLAKSKTT